MPPPALLFHLQRDRETPPRVHPVRCRGALHCRGCWLRSHPPLAVKLPWIARWKYDDLNARYQEHMRLDEMSTKAAPQSDVPAFDAAAVKAELERLSGSPDVYGRLEVSGWNKEPSLFGAYLIASRLCWACLDEIERLTAAQQERA